MRIAHVLFTTGWGGLERYAIEQARLVAQRGHDVIFLRRKNSPAAKNLADFSGPELSPIKYIDLSAMLAIRALVNREEIETVHVHSSGDLGLVAPALWNLPSVRLIFSNYMQIPEQKKDIYHRLEYGRVDSLLVGSRLLKQNAVDNLPIAEQKVMVQPYGIDFSRFDPQITPTGFLRDLPDVAPDSLLIGVISRLEPLKGQMEIIDAMPKILAHHPAAILVLAGDETPELTGKYLPELEARVTKLGLEHKVIFTGYADDTAKVLRDLDVYVLPSHSETFSLGCLEAMAMGRAVVGTEAGGTPEMLGNGELGLLAEPKNPTSLAEKVCLLLDDATLRQKLGSRARTSVLKRHDQKLVIDRLLAFYRGNGHRADIHD